MQLNNNRIAIEYNQKAIEHLSVGAKRVFLQLNCCKIIYIIKVEEKTLNNSQNQRNKA